MLTRIENGIEIPLTAQEEQDLINEQQLRTAEIQSENSTENDFRTALKNLLNPIAGKRYDQITAAEVRLLVALLVHENFKGIDRSTGSYKPINQWVR